jgi:uncharacterized protein
MKIISNTGPIIGLAKLDQLNLLNYLGEEVLIPPLVYRELLGKIDWEASRIDQALNNFIKVTQLSLITPEVEKVISTLDDGEKQVISLGSIFSGEFILLLDDKVARNTAKKLGLPTTGLVGILILAKEKGLIPEIGTLLEELRNKGYWLGDSLIEIAKKLANEN